MKSREQSNLILFFRIAVLEHILKKSAHPLLVHGYDSSWFTFGVHPARGPKTL